jgi:hypothetical protein
MVGHQPVDLGLQRLAVGEVGDADGAAAYLVLIGRTDAAPGGADLLGRRGLARLVEVAVQRQDQAGVVGQHQQVRRDRDALPAQLGDLFQEVPGIDDDPVADDGQLALHHAGRQQRQLVDLIADDERVARVVAALEAHHHVGAVRQPVDELALALVAPLGADHGDIGHLGTIPLPAGEDQPPFDRGSADGADQLWRPAEAGAAGV